jgi:DHA1 family tetracycline resistance protein-like MFS transporter
LGATINEPKEASASAASLRFLLVSLFFDSFAGSMIAPVLPRLLADVGQGGDRATAVSLGLFLSTFAAAQFLSAPVLGALADRFGRRPIILASSLGMAADFFVLAFAPNVATLLAAQAVGGVMAGGWAAAVAYFSDVTPDTDRARRFGHVAAALAAGALLGPALAGLLGEVHIRAPFWVAGGVSLAAAVYGVLVLPESLAPARRRPLSAGSLHALGVARELLGPYPALARWMGVHVLQLLGRAGAQSILPLYAALHFQWGPRSLGLYAASLALVSIGVQAGLVGWVVRQFGEPRAMAGGLALQIVGLLLMAVAGDGVLFWGGGVVLMTGSLATPAFNSIINRQVRSGDRGRLAGASVALGSLVQILAPMAFAGLVGLTAAPTGWLFTGAPFLLGAMFLLLSLAAAAPGFRRLGLPEDDAAASA